VLRSAFRNLTTRLRRLYLQLPEPVRGHSRIVLGITLSLVALYVASGALLAIPIYRGTESKFVRTVEQIYPFPAMSINGTLISMERYRSEVAARQAYAETHGLENSEEEIRQFVIDQLVARTLFAQELAKNNIIITDGDVNLKLQEIYDQVGGEEKLAKFLQQNYGSAANLAMFRAWIRESLVEAAIKKQLLTHVSVRHILIAVPENADDRAVENALAKSRDVRGRISSAEQFAAIAKDFSEDIASRDKGGLLGTTARGDDEPIFSPAFEQAIFSLQVSEISEPIRSRYGWHIVMVESREGAIDMSADQLLEVLKREGSVKVWVKAAY
jgi:peptidyl-prolyl cis-trans isomerase C